MAHLLKLIQQKIRTIVSSKKLNRIYKTLFNESIQGGKYLLIDI